MTHDVIVIGAGVVGAAIARELSRYALHVVLLDAANDVGTGTSKANTAIWHTGFDAKPGSLESRLLQASFPRMEEFVEAAGIPVERTGAILVAWNEEELASLDGIAARGRENGVHELTRLGASEVYEREPQLGDNVLGGLLVEREGIICPFSVPLGLATDAVVNGVSLWLEARVLGRRIEPQHTVVETSRGTLQARWVVNAAGLGSDEVDALFGYARLKIVPRRGELIVFDKLARSLLQHVILPVPTAKTKGVLVSPTVFGNVLLGPTAEDREDKNDTSTTEEGLAGLLEKGSKILPSLMDEEVTATYAGLRAAHGHTDYAIEVDPAQRYVLVGGIRSTGLSASLGIAAYVCNALSRAGLPLVERSDFVQSQVAPIGEAGPRPFERPELIARDPDYGRMVCHCERVSRRELIEATRTPVPARTLDALRRRTRCLQGRCQGFYCLADVTALLSHETGIPMETLLGGNAGSEEP